MFDGMQEVFKAHGRSMDSLANLMSQMLNDAIANRRTPSTRPPL